MLRSQISNIEQDVFLFSRTLAENIAFGAPGTRRRSEIEQAAREAQAHDFIITLRRRLRDGGRRARRDALSGGQRQRIALARAFLSDPRILILDDSTSAIDSATEDEIQKAIRRAQEGRTTLLITHRLSQIRWADLILVLDTGGWSPAARTTICCARRRTTGASSRATTIELPPLETEPQTASRQPCAPPER